ncbi:hypothetical protein ACFWFF_27655 [Streptomyces sp. NPDC060223]|uniref:hypothetical protein n=1 Tax=unclassified Streptomyces TaxID=2593676 RepID=UPI003630BB60
MDTAGVYGGECLVGSRRVVTAPEETLEPFRAKLGGTIQQLRGMGPPRARRSGRTRPSLGADAFVLVTEALRRSVRGGFGEG